VAASVRRPFVLGALAVMSSWSIGGLFLALGPQLSGTLFHSTDHVVASIGVFALAGAGSAGQLVFGRYAPWKGAAYGSIALAAGMTLIVAATSGDSGALFIAGAIVGGAGFGVAFLGALRVLSAAIPNEHRAAVMSAFYIVAYLSISIPVIVAGVVVTPLGLQSTFEIFGSVVAGLALLVALEAWRQRPVADRVPARVSVDLAR
jgi:MFS family permease